MPEETIAERPAKGFRHDLWEIVKVVIISLAIVLPIRYFIVQPFIVRGASMEPNFADREYLVVDEFSFYMREPGRGEVIVFRYPRDPRQFFIKRIIGLPGEEVKIHNGKITIINKEFPRGFVLEESYLKPPGHLTRPDGTIKLSQGELFVLGDNRDFSSDSRVWGPLPERMVIGRVVFRAWPFDRAGTIIKEGYSF